MKKPKEMKVKCPGCREMVDVYWDEEGEPGWRWSGEECPHCGWFTEEVVNVDLFE